MSRARGISPRRGQRGCAGPRRRQGQSPREGSSLSAATPGPAATAPKPETLLTFSCPWLTELPLHPHPSAPTSLHYLEKLLPLGKFISPPLEAIWSKSLLSWVTDRQFPRTMAGGLLSIPEIGDPTPSLGNLCHCSVTLSIKMCFLMFRKSLRCSSLCPLPLALSLGTTGRKCDPGYHQ